MVPRAAALAGWAAALAVSVAGQACEDDAVWSFSGSFDCTAFYTTFAASNAANCYLDGFKAENANGVRVTPYEACAVSCPLDNAAATAAGIPERTCSAAGSGPTCADIDADGTPDDPFDCGASNLAAIYAISATANQIICAGDECTADECCTQPRTCADTLRPRVDGNGQLDPTVQTEWDCTASENSIGDNPAGINCDGQGAGVECSHATCCTVMGIVRTCADLDRDGQDDVSPFDCAGQINSLVESPSSVACGSASVECTAEDCCTVQPPRTCTDTDADGTTDEDPFDCSSVVNELDADPSAILCDEPECTVAKCCTVLPDRTCADSERAGSSAPNLIFDCSAWENTADRTGFIAANPAAVICPAGGCTKDNCCTGTEAPPRTCGDTDANSSPDTFDCTDDVNSLVENPTEHGCDGDVCTAFDCCRIPPPLTCDDTTAVGTSAPHVQYDCSAVLKQLSSTPAEIQCAGLVQCTADECCTEMRDLPSTPPGKATVVSSVTLDASMEDITADLLTFEIQFKQGIAFQYSMRELGSAETTFQDCASKDGVWDTLELVCRVRVSADDVAITDIRPGSVVVDYGVQLPAVMVSSVMATMVGGSVSGFPVVNWGEAVLSEDSCPHSCRDVTYPATADGCTCTDVNKILCPAACTRPRRKVCADAGTTVLQDQPCPPPPPPPPSDDYAVLMPWGWIVLILICFCTAFGKAKQARANAQVQPTDHAEATQFAHMMLARKAGDVWGGTRGLVVPATVHDALSTAGSKTAKGVKMAAGRLTDASFRATELTLQVGGAVAKGAAQAAAQAAVPVAMATMDAGVAVAQGVGHAAKSTGGAARTGVKMAGSGVMAGIAGVAKNVEGFRSKLSKFKRTKPQGEKKALEPQLEPKPEPEPEPEPEPAGTMSGEGFSGAFADPALEPEPVSAEASVEYDEGMEFGELDSFAVEDAPDRGTSR